MGDILFKKSLMLHDLSEELATLFLLSKTSLDASSKILDIGCGKGRFLQLLTQFGYRPEGVEIRPFLVSEVRGRGFTCVTPSEFKKTKTVYDAVLMAHIIEHFNPDKLLEFMDEYFDRVHIGGYVLIATPLPTKAFYYDFDHLRPYFPVGIELVFCNENSQVQYQARNRLERVGLCYRKGPFNGYFWGWTGFSSAIITILGLFFYIFSLKCICLRTGWIGLYRKVGVNNKSE
jgi:SAM-dependent methyltransferase